MTEQNDLIRRGVRRRELMVGVAGAAAAAALAGKAAAETTTAPATGAPTTTTPTTDAATTGAAAGGKADFLFVQTSTGAAWDPDQNRLTLTGVSPVTLFFTDRPERIAGDMNTDRFVPFWSEGKDSFLSDPPNADLSVIEDGVLKQTVVELRDPVLEGGDLHYTVRIIDGELPEIGGPASLFIDVIGMPLTPLSYAGVARRSFRRAAFY